LNRFAVAARIAIDWNGARFKAIHI
jgi:hypothetical protein